MQYMGVPKRTIGCRMHDTWLSALAPSGSPLPQYPQYPYPQQPVPAAVPYPYPYPYGQPQQQQQQSQQPFDPEKFQVCVKQLTYDKPDVFGYSRRTSMPQERAEQLCLGKG